MKLSVSAWSVQKSLFGRELGLLDFIDLCRKEGAEAVELLDCFWEDEHAVEKVRTYLRTVDMPVSAYSIANDFVKAADEREKEIGNVKKGIDIAAFLGTGVLRVFSGEAKEGIPFERAREGIIEAFRECARYARSKGIVMALENHGLFAGKSSQVRGIIEVVGSENLRANTDTGNFLLVGEKPYDAVNNLKDLVALVHFKDFKRVDEDGHYTGLDGALYKGTVIGQGDVPLKDITGLLHSSGYEGYLSIEFEGDGDPVTGTRESIAYTKAVIDQIRGNV